jgi:hypothetical protein
MVSMTCHTTSRIEEELKLKFSMSHLLSTIHFAHNVSCAVGAHTFVQLTSTSCCGRSPRLQADPLLQKILKASATAVLSLALLLVAATPSLAEQPANATTPAFLPSPGDLFGGSDKDKVLSMDEAQEQLSPEEQATVSIFERNTPSVVNISNLASYSRRWVSFFSSIVSAPATPVLSWSQGYL